MERVRDRKVGLEVLALEGRLSLSSLSGGSARALGGPDTRQAVEVWSGTPGAIVGPNDRTLTAVGEGATRLAPVGEFIVHW